MLDYFTNGLDSGMNSQPNDEYRGLQQAIIDDQWDNTSAIEKVLEQDEIGSKTYSEVEVWVNYIVGQGSTGEKTGADFLQFGFRDINHSRTRGRYYKFDNNIWMIYDYNFHNGLARNVAVRRCNNVLRWINPLNGAVETVPCIVDYDMSSPSIQVTQSILTPNNHAVVKIQGNDLTNSQLKTNMRFILGGRPFKLYGLQDTLLENQTDQNPTYLVYDLYLDEIQANDDIESKIAFNGHYDYTIVPSQLSISAMNGTVGQLTANVLLNGEDVDRSLVWESSDSEVIEINQNGEYIILGEEGETANVSVYLEGNPSQALDIPVTIVEVMDSSLDIYITPIIDKIREYETIEFEVKTYKCGALYNNFTSGASLDGAQSLLSNRYLTISQIGTNKYKLSCTAFNSTLKTLYITVVDIATNETFQKSFDVRTVNMFG